MVNKKIFLLLLLSSLLSTTPIFAEFPAKKLEILVYTNPGGLIDITARKIAKIMQDQVVKVPVIVQNKKGAGGIVAVSSLLRKPSDGYTILGITSSVISKHVQSKKVKQLDQLDFLARMVTDYECLIVDKNGSIKDFNSLIADAELKEGKQLWAGPAAGGTDHLFAQKVWKTAKLKARWVPYPSGTQAIASIMGQHAQVYVGNPGDTQGRPSLKLIAVASPQRLVKFPEVPTFAELGYDELTGSMLWRGFAIKKGTSEPQKNFWKSALKQVSETKEWQEFITKGFMKPAFDTDDIFEQLVQQQVVTDQDFFTKG